MQSDEHTDFNAENEDGSQTENPEDSINSYPLRVSLTITKVSHVVPFQPAPKAKSTVVYELRQAARL